MWNGLWRFYYRLDLCAWHLDWVELAPHLVQRQYISLLNCSYRHRMYTLMDKSQLLWLWRVLGVVGATNVQLFLNFFSLLRTLILLMIPWLLKYLVCVYVCILNIYVRYFHFISQYHDENDIAWPKKPHICEYGRDALSYEHFYVTFALAASLLTLQRERRNFN